MLSSEVWHIEVDPVLHHQGQHHTGSHINVLERNLSSYDFITAKLYTYNRFLGGRRMKVPVFPKIGVFLSQQVFWWKSNPRPLNPNWAFITRYQTIKSAPAGALAVTNHVAVFPCEVEKPTHHFGNVSHDGFNHNQSKKGGTWLFCWIFFLRSPRNFSIQNANLPLFSIVLPIWSWMSCHQHSSRVLGAIVFAEYLGFKGVIALDSFITTSNLDVPLGHVVHSASKMFA